MKKVLLVLGILFAALVVLAGGVALIGYLYVKTAEPVEPDAEDLALLVGPEQIQPYFYDFEPEEGALTMEKVVYFDDSVELTMTYETEREDHPYMEVTITREPKMSDAVATIPLYWGAMVAGMKVYGDGISVDDGYFDLDFGPQTKVAVLRMDGEPFGNMVAFRDGHVSYVFMMSGFFIEDEELMELLFREVSRKLSSFD